MISGPSLIIKGTLVIGAVLSYFLYSIAAAAPFPEIPGDRPQAESVEHESADMGKGAFTDAELLIESGEPDRGGGCAISPAYPPAILQWCKLITRYAEKRGLSPDLVAALILQESGGDPLAYSRSGAVGLMQVMPSDGLAAGFMCISGPCFSSRPSAAKLQDPEFNIAYGTRMLSGLLRRNGSLREALRAYGPMNVGYSYADKVLGIFQRHEEQG